MENYSRVFSIQKKSYEEFYEEVMRHDVIVSLLYSPVRVNGMAVKDQIVTIKTSEITWANDKSCFFYIWGYLCPDCNRYTTETYGRGWAFTEREILDAYGEK